jgi:hypothetical protein
MRCRSSRSSSGDGELDRVAVLIGQDLDLDVPGTLQIALGEDPPVAERGLRLAAGGGEGRLQIPLSADHPQSTAAAAGERLDHERVPVLAAERLDLLRRGVVALGAGQHRYAGLAGQPLGAGLVPHQLDRRRRWPDPAQARGAHRLGKGRTLAQEPVAGVDGAGAGARRRLEDHLEVEVAGDAQREVGATSVRGAAVGVGEDRGDPKPESARGALHTKRDLATVGDEHGAELLQIRGSHGLR